MRKKKYRDIEAEQKKEILESIESGEVLDFDDPKWWEWRVEEFKEIYNAKRWKYPVVLFARISKTMSEGIKYPSPGLQELKVGILNNSKEKIDQFISMKRKILWFSFPNSSDLPELPDRNENPIHENGWQMELRQNPQFYKRLEAYVNDLMGNSQEADALRAELQSLRAQNKSLVEKYESKLNGRDNNKKKSERKAESTSERVEAST